MFLKSKMADNGRQAGETHSASPSDIAILSRFSSKMQKFTGWSYFLMRHTFVSVMLAKYKNFIIK